MTTLVIESCGALTSIQDGGRRGYERVGIPRSGALDPLALSVANALVGNPPTTAAIELLLGGIALTCVEGNARLALAGGDFPIRLDGEDIPHHMSFIIRPSQRLSIRSARSGVTGILAVEGGFDLPEMLGSRSLCAAALVGGIRGRYCQPGDQLMTSLEPGLRAERRVPPLAIATDHPLRVVLGPQDEYFSEEAVKAFLESSFEVRTDSSRMAYRLEGPVLGATRAEVFISDGIVEGSIQVTGAGQLIVPLVDRQTIGGYPKIATVITPDRRLLAQCRAGARVRFRSIPVADAQNVQRRSLQELRKFALRSHFSEADAVCAKYYNFDYVADNCVNALD